MLKLTDNLANTHQLRQKLQQHSEVPDNDIEAYVPYFNIKDDVDDPEDTRFLAIFATKRTLSLLSKSDILHVDATYRLNWNRYPVMIVGVSSAQGKFFGSFAVLSSHEDTEAWKEIYSFVHRQDIHSTFRTQNENCRLQLAPRQQVKQEFC